MVADEPLVGLDRDRAVGVVAAVEQRRAQPLLVAAVGDLADELVDQVAAVGEDQHAAGRVASMKPTAATVLPAPVACSNQKRRAAPGSSGASSTTSSSSSAGSSSQSWGSSSGASSSSSSSSSLARRRRPVGVGSSASAAARRLAAASSSPPLPAAVGAADLLLGHQLGQGPGEGVDLVRVQFGAVAQLRRFVGEEALQPEQQREVAAPLDRGVLGAVVELLQRRVERAAARGPRRQRLGPLAVEQEGLAGERRRTLDIGA